MMMVRRLSIAGGRFGCRVQVGAAHPRTHLNRGCTLLEKRLLHATGPRAAPQRLSSPYSSDPLLMRVLKQDNGGKAVTWRSLQDRVSEAPPLAGLQPLYQGVRRG